MPNHPEQQYFDGDWAYAEGVEDVGIEWSLDREFAADPAPVAKGSGIKARRGNPTNKQMLYTNAIGIGVQATDQVWTIWESTFRDSGQPKVMPMQGDIILVVELDSNGAPVSPVNILERWLVQWSKVTLYGAQYLCYCSESPLNEDAQG